MRRFASLTEEELAELGCEAVQRLSCLMPASDFGQGRLKTANLQSVGDWHRTLAEALEGAKRWLETLAEVAREVRARAEGGDMPWDTPSTSSTIKRLMGED